MVMVRELIVAFLDGILAGLVYFFLGNMILQFFPALPYNLSGILLFGILVMIADLILREFARI